MEERVYRLLIEHTNQGMLLLQGGKLVLVNQSFANLVGYEINELLSFSTDEFLNLVDPQDREGASARYTTLLTGKENSETFDCRFIRKDGEFGWWSATLSLIEYQGAPAVLGIYVDISERKKVEDTVDRWRLLLAATLDALPVGVCLTDEQGYYRLMNDAYCAVYDYKREEMIGRHYSVIMPPDQIELANKHYAQMLGGDVGIPVERKRQRKDGSIIYIEAANALVEGADGQKLIITTVRDITERKQVEEIIHIRLRLYEYAASHSQKDLMIKALDEIGEMTGSLIGFYHFVAEDQNTLSLQAWSTRTLQVFCKAEGEGMHYPVSEAGVWTDCIAEKKAVVHNDYKSLPHRKGLPEGHAEIVRELVVPTIRDGRVVAILGVGNKPFIYSEQDVELITYIADLVWSIIEQKQAEDQILELNARLEYLAMTDELTGLMNRRYFLMECEREIKRAQRYQTPFSVLMLDVDRFKSVNDRYGHSAGDLLLQKVSQVLQENFRETDVVARFGGEEFSILLTSTSSGDAVKLAERARMAFEQMELEFEGQIIKRTLSIGVAAFGDKAANVEDIIRKADASLYQAKRSGRNKVVFLD